MEDNRNCEFEIAAIKEDGSLMAEPKQRYKVTVGFESSEDMRTEKEYQFKKPNVYSYDRYVKALSKSPTKASRAFVLDNIVEEQRQQFTEDLEQYPAIAITISDKLLSMLGLGEATLTKL